MAQSGTLGTLICDKILSHRAQRTGGDTIGMTKHGATDAPNAMTKAAANGRLGRKLLDYLASCRPPPDADPKKNVGRFPNLAGFCRYLGCGLTASEELHVTHPAQYDYVCAVLEDEALNFSPSPTVTSAYLKQRLGYGEKPDAAAAATECGSLQLIFEHDISEDGA